MEKRPDEIYAQQKKLAIEFADWSTENPPSELTSEMRKNWKVYFSNNYGCFYFEYDKFYDFDEADMMINALSNHLKESNITWPFLIKYKYGGDNIGKNWKNISYSHYQRELGLIRGGDDRLEEKVPHISIEEAVQLGFFKSYAHAMANLKRFRCLAYKDGKLWLELDDLIYQNSKINSDECPHIHITNR